MLYGRRLAEEFDPKKLVKRVDVQPLIEKLKALHGTNPYEWYLVGLFPNRNFASNLKTYKGRYLEWEELDIETCTTPTEPQANGAKAYWVWARLV